MSTAVLYTKDAKVWLPDPVNVWKIGKILEDFKSDSLKLAVETGEEIKVPIKDIKDLPPLRNPEFLIGGNDLTSLSYLHEPAVLHTLKVRFMNYNAIYTYCGIVLVAINPYQELSIYSQDTVLAYRNRNQYGSLDPHIFAVAEEAFTKMERESQDQSIIVSGESGAGKTVSAKYAMRYFATAGGSSTETQVERKVLASSPIMEAIGNAKTTRNDNSSRFGKYIELGFNKDYHIQGAGMRTYLLEKSRVVFQSAEERNYHIFYQLCAASSLPEMAYLQLQHQDHFLYTRQGGCPSIEGVDDLAEFQETRRALLLLGFSEDQQADIFRLLAGILHLGNVTIVDADHEGSNISKTDTYLASFCSLVGLDAASSEELRKWLCFRQIVSMKEVFTKPMTKAEASFARDALAKHIYSLLFQKIVSMINKSLASSSRPHRFIGVLDIYGFETFEWNSFEQFCINYANEKLQQQFNQHVFKLEQEEYVREKIDWTFIDFYDNQPCIDLIEKPLGILDLLDEECRVPKGADQAWVEKLYIQCKKYDQFVKPRLSNSAFIIVHFADRVEYQCLGFVEKNRDTVLEEQVQVLRSSSNGIVRQLILDEETIVGGRSPAAAAAGSRSVVGTVPRGGGSLMVPGGASGRQSNTMTKQNRRTVGSQFRESLTLLMNTLNATTPHYVRCIKPNDSKESFVFEPRRAVQQLRACGVLETVRISAAGFPSRLTYEEFIVRYRVLFHSRQCQRKQRDLSHQREACESVLSTLITEDDKFKFGANKIFFRAGQVAYLEKRRTDKLRACGILIQRMIRGWFYRKRYLKLRLAVVGVQRFCRGHLARRKAQHLRETRSAITIQRHVRGFLQRRSYTRLRQTVLGLQTYGRGFLARKKYLQLVCNSKAVIIQKMVRSFLARRRYLRARKSIILLQCCWRRWLARRQYKALRAEARSIEHVKNLNKGLENKIISMQQRIEEMNKELIPLRQKQNDYAELKIQCEANRGLANELKVSVGRIGELELLVKQLQTQLDRERDEKMDLVLERERLDKHNEELNSRIDNIQKELLNSAETNQTRSQEAEDAIKRRLDQERAILAQEYDQERAAYQKLLQDYHEMEERMEEAERELERLREEPGKTSKSETVRGHSRNASNVSTLSNTSELIADPEDDGGYGSVRLVPNRSDSEDVGLVLKLQQRLKTVEKDKATLATRVEELERESPTADVRRAQDMIRLQELEMENAKIKEDLKNLRRQSATEHEGHLSRSPDMLMSQFEAMSDELDRRREECIQLRTVLANTTLGGELGEQTALNASRLNGGEPFAEDNEILLAFETQKRIIRHLENELQEEKAASQRKIQIERDEVERLRIDNERQAKVLAGALHRTPQGQTDAVMQHEISRLTADNLDLQEKNDLLSEQLKKYRSQMKLSKKMKQDGLMTEQQEITQEVHETVHSSRRNERSESLPVVRKKDTNYLGMFDFNMGDEKQIARNLVYELKPRVASTLLPGLPAYIIFMCVRHADYINNDEKIRSFLTLIINAIRRLIKKRYEDLDTSVVWLVNTCRLLHSLKQYSGEKTFQEENTPKQNEQCLRNFDLSEYRQVLSDIAVWIYQAVIKFMEERVQQLIVTAVLEHEAISGLSSHKQPVGQSGRARSGSTRDTTSPVDPQEAIAHLLRELTIFHQVLQLYGVDPPLIAQAFRQVFYYICACALNNLLLRKEMCHWSKGIQIRYNISHLEQWVRDQHIHGQDTMSASIADTLQPIIQAAQLLQARKSDDDVTNICVMCSRLTSAQIIKILNLYTPADELEDRIPISFIRKVQEELQKRNDPQAQSKLLMDTKHAFTVRFPYSPSSIKLEDIDIPAVLNLPMLKKV